MYRKLLKRSVKNENLNFVTITEVDTTQDLSYAKVYFTVLKDEYKEETLEALNKASNFIELELSKRIDIRKMPEISFHYDNSVEYGENIEKKLQELKEENKL